MPCYPCTHCNRCGLFSMKLDLRCKNCGAPIAAGAGSCPECGVSYRHNMRGGKLEKPKGSEDYYTKMEEASQPQSTAESENSDSDTGTRAGAAASKPDRPNTEIKE